MIAQDIERVWRDEVPVARAVKGGPVPSNSNLSATQVKAEENTADSILARLKRDNPELAQQVISGETTANAGKLPMGRFGHRRAPGQ